jgi:ATP-binding cassette, subfamily C (CFTR/MRP), member 1
VWLKHWSEVNGAYGSNPNIGKYLGIYFAFGIGSSALVVVQTLILWIFCSIEVSEDGAQRSRFFYCPSSLPDAMPTHFARLQRTMQR